MEHLTKETVQKRINWGKLQTEKYNNRNSEENFIDVLSNRMEMMKDIISELEQIAMEFT